MSSAAGQLHTVTFEAFLDGETVAGRRHELVGGRVYVMAGGTERHDLAAGLVYEALAPGARAAGCLPFTSNRLLRAQGSGYYPDVVVVCGPAGHRLYETDATVVVEVLSPTTAQTDRREKALAYAGLPSLGLYLLVDPESPRVEVARPSADGLQWEAFGPGDVVITPAGPLDLDELYALLQASATTS